MMQQDSPDMRSVADAYKFLQVLGAPPRLLQHVKLVGEAAEILILNFQKLRVPFDPEWVRLGVACHDAGKILHPHELIDRGNRHEAAGEELLLAHGIDLKIARCCRSHAQWQQLECDFEELVVALADCLWKGKRQPELERQAIERSAKLTDRDYWDLFVRLDDVFESIASNSDERLGRSI